MSVLKILEWIITSHNVVTCWVLLIFSFSLLWLLLKGRSK